MDNASVIWQSQQVRFEIWSTGAEDVVPDNHRTRSKQVVLFEQLQVTEIEVLPMIDKDEIEMIDAEPCLQPRNDLTGMAQYNLHKEQS